MQCDTCKYFAVPLTREEKSRALCPGANPHGNPAQKICALSGKFQFDPEKLRPGSCAYYFPVFLKFR